ncbi:PucR family transcriptional regulator [Nocardia arizonensis]|uniref:PucR family transcriptional regulator n=1 Tax=Nocardia arizonensis TaxID=1141647 RepID=UPI0006D0A4A0|nr:helix-turn-helix domain-containing protein [Nocardia arizonensis]
MSAIAKINDSMTLARPTTAGPHPDAAQIGARPGDAMRCEDPALARICAQLLTETINRAVLPEAAINAQLEQVRRITKAWSRQGVSIDAMHRAVRTASDQAFDRVVASTATRDPHRMATVVKRFLQVRERLTAAVSVAYIQDVGGRVGHLRTPLHRLASALAGDGQDMPHGAPVADAYAVLAVSIPRTGDALDPGAEDAARATLERVQRGLNDHRGLSTLSVLGVHGGTVLVPATDATRDTLSGLIADLSRAARVPLTAAVLYGSRTQIRQIADGAHELLDVAQRLHLQPGLYEFGDLALEYQLTRPGPAMNRLAAAIDPLEEHPGLLQTLLLYIRNNLRRQDTARMLNLHRNTVDYRLRRIQELTGYDPAKQSGLFYLQCALIAHAYRRSQRKDQAVPNDRTANAG